MFAAEASAVIQHLPSLQDEGAAFFEAASAGNGVALDMADMEAEETGVLGFGVVAFLNVTDLEVTCWMLICERRAGRWWRLVLV